jgi:hypothetical protein
MVADAAEAQGIRDAISEAVGNSEFVATLQSEADGDVFASAADPAVEGDENDKGDGTEDKEEGSENASGASAVDDVTDEDLPDVYWGTSLKGLSAEQKRGVIKALEQRDSKIQQLQTKLAAGPPEPKAGDQDEPDVEITDDDILRAVGIDPEGDPFEVEQARKHTLPLAKQIIQLEETVGKIADTESLRETATAWNSELDRLEHEYGKLPGDRVQVLQYAANEGIANPEVLYLRLTAPTRQAVEAEIAKVRQTEAKKAAQGGVRPRSTATGAKSVDTEGLSLRDTVMAAAKAAQEETGKRWSDVLKNN